MKRILIVFSDLCLLFMSITFLLLTITGYMEGDIKRIVFGSISALILLIATATIVPRDIKDLLK